MSDETVRGNIVNAINALTHLLEFCADSNQQFEIRVRIRELFCHLDRLIVAVLDSGTREFADTIASLQALTETAIKAKDELDTVTETLKKASEAVGRVEMLVRNVSGVLKIR
jgi:hypothetical protein